MTEKISSYRFGVGKYFHEKEVLSHLREELRGFSDKALVISGKKAMEALEEQDFRKCLKDAGVSFREELYVGYPNTEKVEYFSKLAREEGYGVLIGAGGGKIMDLSKAVANQAGLPLLLIPTTEATCAAFTPLSYIRRKENTIRLSTLTGKWMWYWWMKQLWLHKHQDFLLPEWWMPWQSMSRFLMG